MSRRKLCYRILTRWMMRRRRRIVRTVNKKHVIMEDAREREMDQVSDEEGDAKGSEETTL